MRLPSAGRRTAWQGTVIGEMMKNGTREQIDRVTQTFLPMKKFDIVKLKKAYEEGEGTWQNT